jgi:hypothetical protein
MESIDAYIGRMAEGHRLHRKIRFLLDIRGLLILNKIEGDYVEFGVYRGEMMYAAAKILSPHIRKYIGLDTFAGLPVPGEDDEKIYVFESQGSKEATRDFAETMMSGSNASLIEGDFRHENVQREYLSEASQISVLCIDCNWPSSVRAAMETSAPLLQNGSVVYIDDYFVGTRHKNFNDPILEKISRENDIKFVEFMTYPPFGRAFVVEKE